MFLALSLLVPIVLVETTSVSLPLSSILEDLDQLKTELDGYLLTATNENFAQAIRIDNPYYKSIPLVVVYAASSNDIALSIQFSKKHQLPFRVKGAHSLPKPNSLF